jgi:hypothetical protein
MRIDMIRLRFLIGLAAFYLAVNLVNAAEKTIGVFVALADNKTQGIVKVPKAIGNGEDPEMNLYWGAADGLKGCFDASKDWRRIEAVGTTEAPEILRMRTYHNAAKNLVIQARAYRGSALKKCIVDFETSVQLGSYDLVVFIGHNGLMDFDLPMPDRSNRQAKRPDCIVLCCKSEQYFKQRILAAGGHPILLTTQLMYPGAFLLKAVADVWSGGASLAQIRERAAAAYAENQKISPNAALGVFAKLKDD